MITALYVDPKGPYPRLNVESYGPDRDARRYNGPWPVIAHPPCTNYSQVRLFTKRVDSDCALVALSQVRKFGGVLEHPAYSKLWKVANLPPPGYEPDEFGGFTILVKQCDFGHPAMKKTWLYIKGVSKIPKLPSPRAPTHWCSGTHTPGQKGTVPDGIKICSAFQRRLTPPDFAKWLIELVKSVK